MYIDPDPEFEKLMVLVRARGGLDCQYYKIPYLKRRVAVRMRATGMESYKDYNRLLIQDAEEFDRLLDRLTINVSRFFRDPGMYAAMERKILPSLLGLPKVLVWSAGCANGEEPYSVAIQWLQSGGDPARLKVLATDVDLACLERAKQGRYKDAAVVELANDKRERFFQRSAEEWVIRPEIRAMISFQRQDLTGDRLPLGPFDLILCRNVMIYFNQELQQRLIQTFHQRLGPEGFFILGKTEVLFSNSREWFKMIDIAERVYQKRELKQP